MFASDRIEQIYAIFGSIMEKYGTKLWRAHKIVLNKKKRFFFAVFIIYSNVMRRCFSEAYCYVVLSTYLGMHMVM